MNIEELRKYNVPESVITKLKELGFSKLTEVQKLAVEKGLFEGKNFVISAPTNTGKTFIGELAILTAAKRIERRKTFYLTPLKAIAEEKFEEFREKYGEWGLQVAISTGERSEYDANLIEYDLIIATYEKLNSLLIKNPELIDEIGVVIVDELQMIDDEGRGVDLEILLTKIMYNAKSSPQIIGLSATIPNAKDLGEWLKAEVIETQKREVELREGIIYTGDGDIRFKGYTLKNGDFLYREFNTGNMNVERGLNIHSFDGFIDISQREQIIIFVNTQKNAEKLALRISKRLPPSGDITKWIEKIDALVESTPSTRDLKKCMINGVAFHHAGLLPEEKRIVEEAFENGDIRVICSTLTLGAGVNTPAKTVIIRSTEFRDRRGIRRDIKSRDYKNMSGRAGRIRYHDDFGRSVLFAKTEKDFERYWQGYINSKAEKIESQIQKRDNIESSILNLIASGVCKNVKELIKFMENTFFGYIYYRKIDPSFRQAFEESVSKQIQELIKMGILEDVEGKIKATELGKRCAEEMVSPYSAHIIFHALEKINEEGPIDDYNALIEPIIHLACCTPDARLLYPPRYKQEKEVFIYWEANREKYLFHPNEEEIILKATKTTQMLLRWIDGVPYSDLKGFAPQGIIKNRGENISWIIKSMKKIAEPPLFNFTEEFYEFLERLSDRVKYGVRDNAVSIMKLNIPAIHRHRAMLLADAGYTSLESLINAKIDDLEKVKGIDRKLATTIKEHIEQFIEDKMERKRQYFIRRAKELGRDSTIIERLFTETGDNFSEVCAELFNDHFKIPCKFIGNLSLHEPDLLIEVEGGKIVVECKRKIGNKFVSATEAEEILGKGAKYNPIAKVTIGYPDFEDVAKQNADRTKITLTTHVALAEMLLAFWERKISQEEIIEILKSGKYVESISE
ncbi:MAG: Replicative superfamily II helicase [Candidatus Alkanophagales archaeon MCA70_species_2]|nr:Replicative superfamily II helicase [Candidatus Alkanophaga liquidiphilum]